MDETEAAAVAAGVLAERKSVPFAELAALVDDAVWVDRAGASGAQYAVKVYGLWDAGVIGGDRRVVADAMDGTRKRLRMLRATSADFIVAPSGHILE